MNGGLIQLIRRSLGPSMLGKHLFVSSLLLVNCLASDIHLSKVTYLDKANVCRKGPPTFLPTLEICWGCVEKKMDVFLEGTHNGAK